MKWDALVLAGLAALLAGAWSLGSGVLVLLWLLLAATLLVSRLWGRHALDGVGYRRRFSTSRTFAGEPVTLEVELVNRKLLPVTDLLVEDVLPDHLALQGRRLGLALQHRSILRHLFTAGWYMRVRRRYTVVPQRRGLYRVGPAVLTAGDPFGFVSSQREVPGREELLVYPPVLPLPAVGLPSHRPFGDLRSSNWLFPDPLRFAGVRDYQPGDPPQRVHWRATAAAGRLQTRELEPSAQGGLAVLVNQWSFDTPWQGSDPEARERGILAAAAAAGWAVERGFPLGLFSNGRPEGWSGELDLPVARGPAVLPQALEGLARLSTVAERSLVDVLAGVLPRLPYGTALLYVGRGLAPEVAQALLAARRRGHPVTALLTGAGLPLPDLPGIPCHAYAVEVSGHAAAV